jgi:small subunit ribosomal protein S12
MPTINQLLNKQRIKKNKKNKTPALNSCPQKKGTCLQVLIQTPRKPNSASRKIVKLRLFTGKTIRAYIPGEGHNLRRYNDVLVRGGRVKDLPGMKYTLVRGKFDLEGLNNRRQGRSKYGGLHPKK